MTARHWTADSHLGHAKIAELRGFASTDEHDDRIMAQLHKIPAGDEVWILGDISSGRPEGEARALERLADVPATLHLIAGNHDSVSSIHRGAHKRQRAWLDVFASVQQFARIKVSGRDVLMSHYPYARSGDGPDRGPGRYDEYRLPDAGMPLIHGHTHQADVHAPYTKIFRDVSGYSGMVMDFDRSQFCVSWDAHRGIVSESRLNAWMAHRERLVDTSPIAQIAGVCANHRPTQHRDGKPPWCNACGLTAGGGDPVSSLTGRLR